MSIFQLHHNGYLTADLEKTAGMFKQRFGYQTESGVIHDPVQTAQVQFLRQPGGHSWLELVRPDGPGSKLARSLEKRGEGWHHICYEVTEIVTAGAALRTQEMLCVCEPVLASAFPGRRIAWFVDSRGLLVELVETGASPCLSVAHLEAASPVEIK